MSISNSPMFLSPFFLFFSLCPLVFSQQSSNQTSTMITLSQLLNNPALPWNITREPNPCSWKGVECTGSSVIQLSLSGVGLSSSEFLPVVCQIGSLQVLDVSNNQLRSIPDEFITSCGEIDGLKLLNFSRNRLVGSLPTFHGFVGLEFLDLSYNSLNGMIPQQLSSCQHLRVLDLAQNDLTGSLPEQLGNLSHLQVMKLQLNKLSGEIPSQFAQLRVLSTLDISWNSLTGSIPSSISDMQKLTNLNLQGNNLIGTIPSSIRNMDSLIELQLGENRLRGTIPRMPTKLQIALNLSSNLFEGSIPPTLGELTGLEVLDLSNNKFSGEIPDYLTGMGSLEQLILSNNRLSGDVPKFGSFVSLNISGNPDLRNATAENVTAENNSPGPAHKSEPFLLAFIIGFFFFFTFTLLVTSLFTLRKIFHILRLSSWMATFGIRMKH